MPLIELPFAIVLQQLDGEYIAGEPLLVPELSTVDTGAEMVSGVLLQLAEALLKNHSAEELWRRVSPPNIVVDSLDLRLAPLPGQRGWLAPIDLRLQFCRWQQSPSVHVAYFPALGIEVIGGSPSELQERLEDHLLATLQRTGARTSLRQLTWLQRTRELAVQVESLRLTLPTPREAARQREELDRREDTAANSAVWKQVATDLVAPTKSRLDLFEMGDEATRLAELLTASPPRSVLLVGPAGVGKTAVVRAMLHDRWRLGIGDIPVWGTTGARLVAGMTGFGMWESRCQKVVAEATRLRAILHLGNLLELLHVGRSEMRSQGIASFLRPRIQRGELVSIAECTPEQLTLIEREDPQLAAAFTHLTVQPPDTARTLRILQGIVGHRRRAERDVEPAALDELLRLHTRYLRYSANPGRPIRFLKTLMSGRSPSSAPAATFAAHPAATPPAAAVTPAEVSLAFARDTGLPNWLLSDEEPLDLRETRAWFQQRVVGQEGAIDLIVDLVATIKGRMARPGRPLASLLLIGPTGVGKTELAKALAEYFFGDNRRLTRFDMSEYGDEYAVQRLFGGAFAAEGLLTAKIREQPFSVLLFDEVEKAAPLFFDLMLSVFGDARLTDGAGRVADFSNAILVMTSNLGASTFQRGSVGWFSEQCSQQNAVDHFTREVQQYLRPEMFNRLDRVVPFLPLSAETIAAIVDRQLELVRRRDGLGYRDVALHIDETVIGELARRGYDSRYGARPLKRAMERDLLVPLAEGLSAYAADCPVEAQVTMQGERIRCEVRAAPRQAPPRTGRGETTADPKLVTALLDLRRDLQRLQRCPAMLEFQNRLYQWRRQLDRIARAGQSSNESEQRLLAQLSRGLEREHAVQELAIKVADAAEAASLDLYANRSLDRDLFQELQAQLTEELEQELRHLLLSQHEQPDAVNVAVLSEDGPIVNWLGMAYREAAEHWGISTQVWTLHAAENGPAGMTKGGTTGKPLTIEQLEAGELAWEQRATATDDVPERWELVCRAPDGATAPWLERRRVTSPEDYFHGPFVPGVLGLVLELSGPAAGPRWAGEGGWYRWRDSHGERHALVVVESGSLREFIPPLGIDRRGSLRAADVVRIYDETAGQVVDCSSDVRTSWPRGQLGQVFVQLLERRLHERARRLIADES